MCQGFVAAMECLQREKKILSEIFNGYLPPIPQSDIARTRIALSTKEGGHFTKVLPPGVGLDMSSVLALCRDFDIVPHIADPQKCVRLMWKATEVVQSTPAGTIGGPMDSSSVRHPSKVISHLQRMSESDANLVLNYSVTPVARDNEFEVLTFIEVSYATVAGESNRHSNLTRPRVAV